jgi:hypothetical protein
MIFFCVLNNQDYGSGLKGCEKQLGANRWELDSVAGYFAVLLCTEFQQTLWH